MTDKTKYSIWYAQTMEKAIKGEELSEKELKELRQYAKEEILGEPLRWIQYVDVILEYNGKFYAFTYQRGLTEYQEDIYEENTLEEVIPMQKLITEYVRKSNVV